MRKLLLGAAAALAALAVPAASPAEASHRDGWSSGADVRAVVHFAGHRDRWDRRHWRGRHWRWRDDWRWHHPRPWGWRSHPGISFGFGWGWGRPACRSWWWDGWAWRCRW